MNVFAWTPTTVFAPPLVPVRYCHHGHPAPLPAMFAFFWMFSSSMYGAIRMAHDQNGPSAG